MHDFIANSLMSEKCLKTIRQHNIYNNSITLIVIVKDMNKAVSLIKPADPPAKNRQDFKSEIGATNLELVFKNVQFCHCSVQVLRGHLSAFLFICNEETSRCLECMFLQKQILN